MFNSTLNANEKCNQIFFTYHNFTQSKKAFRLCIGHRVGKQVSYSFLVVQKVGNINKKERHSLFVLIILLLGIHATDIFPRVRNDVCTKIFTTASFEVAKETT